MRKQVKLKRIKTGVPIQTLGTTFSALEHSLTHQPPVNIEFMNSNPCEIPLKLFKKSLNGIAAEFMVCATSADHDAWFFSRSHPRTGPRLPQCKACPKPRQTVRKRAPRFRPASSSRDRSRSAAARDARARRPLFPAEIVLPERSLKAKSFFRRSVRRASPARQITKDQNPLYGGCRPPPRMNHIARKPFRSAGMSSRDPGPKEIFPRETSPSRISARTG